MEHTLALGTKSQSHAGIADGGSRVVLPPFSSQPFLANTPPPVWPTSRPGLPPAPLAPSVRGSTPEPEPTAHAGGPVGAGLPRLGDIVLGFRIVEKIGQGGFGSVFLGEQVGLADRPVALKFTSRATTEPERMATLQHANVVPVYSVHSQPPLQVLCMPFRGRHTLADAVAAIARTKSLPATGAGLLSTTPKAKDDTRRTRRPAAPAEGTPAPTTAPVETPQPIRDMLARLSFPESVAWLFTRLADGLAHAHERGIVHLDLKPANVLITDDGMPMILDFGLAHDVREVGYAVTGGTVRYMSPEQLAGFVNPDGFVPDRRMDLYSLGVMFFELLTGRHPFGESRAGTPLPALLATRQTAPPRATAFNRDVSPSVAAIVAKLLQPDPAHRYQSAHELLTDLNRHQESLPLKYAGNPSLVERARKFRRRHPVGAMAAAALFFATVASLALGVAVSRGRERAALEATASAAALDREMIDLRSSLSAGELSRLRDQGLTKSGTLFDAYEVGRNAHWTTGPALAPLTESGRQAVRRTLGELAVLSAHAEETAATGKGAAERAEALRRAVAWNRRAMTCFVGMPVPPVVWEQAERLAAKTGDPAPPRPESEAEVTSFDRYVRGVILLADGKYNAAAKQLDELVASEPGHAAGQFSLGVAYQSQGKFADALERFQLAKALSPTDHRPALQRGSLLLALGRAADAAKEFDTALQRDPTCGTALYHRAIARNALGDAEGGVADLTKAVEVGEPALRCLLYRARLYDLLKNPTLAAADRTKAARLEPEDETDFLSRGVSRVREQDAAGGLADFDKAVELNPRYLAAWVNRAHVFAERMNPPQPEKAVESLGAAIELAPEYAPALAGRAVVRARLKDRAGAHEDAEKALALSKDPKVRMQVACVYSLTSMADAADLTVALKHFRQAIRDGYDIQYAAADRDLVALRDTEGYRKLVAAVQQLNAK